MSENYSKILEVGKMSDQFSLCEVKKCQKIHADFDELFRFLKLRIFPLTFSHDAVGSDHVELIANPKESSTCGSRATFDLTVIHDYFTTDTTVRSKSLPASSIAEVLSVSLSSRKNY